MPESSKCQPLPATINPVFDLKSKPDISLRFSEVRFEEA